MNTVEDSVRETLKTLETLKPCKSCIFANDDCSWCFENKIKITPYKYGCNKHITNEAAIRKLAEIEYQKYCQKIAKATLDLDIMGYTINAAAIMLEKIDAEMEQSYKEIKAKDNESERKHSESKRNRDKLRRAYVQMKSYAADMRNTYNKYIEYFLIHQFSDDKGKLNGVEYDKNSANAGIISKVVKIFVDRSLENEENATKIIDFMLSLEGSGIYDEHDFNNGMLKS